MPSPGIALKTLQNIETPPHHRELIVRKRAKSRAVLLRSRMGEFGTVHEDQSKSEQGRLCGDPQRKSDMGSSEL